MDPGSLQTNVAPAPRKESMAKPKPKSERKVEPTQVAFGFGSSATTIKSYGVQKSGSNSDLLDGQEFEMVSEAAPYDETTIKSAIELGLMEENQEPSFFFLRMPATIPLIARSATMDGQEPAGSSSSTPSMESRPMQNPSSVHGLLGGFMGKMVIYKCGVMGSLKSQLTSAAKSTINQCSKV